MKKLVSVIVPCYNQARFLREAVDSVLGQTYPDFEVIIVDDGSTDNTAAVAADIRDRRVKYLHQANRGLAGARNAGLQRACGEYVAFLDADDLFVPQKLEWQVAELEQNPALGLVSAGWAYLGSDGQVWPPIRPWEYQPRLDLKTWILDCPTVVCGVLVRREWVDRVGGFDEGLRQAQGGEDRDLWLRLAYAGCQMEWTRKTVCHYRMHGTNMTGNAAGQKQSQLAVLDSFFASPALPAWVLDLKQDAYFITYLAGAAREYAVGQLAEAKADMLYLTVLDPCAAEREELILNAIVAYSSHPYVADQRAYINLVFDNLPDELLYLRRLRSVAHAQVSMTSFYQAYDCRDWRTVAAAFPAAVRHEARWLRNRGAVKMWALGLGRHMASMMPSYGG